MPTVQAIQIKLSLQTSGEEAIKRFAQQIQSLAKIPIKLNLNSALSASTASLTKVIDKAMPNITNAIANGVAKAIDDVSARVKQMFGQLESDVKKKQGLISKILLGDNFQTTTARMMASVAVQAKATNVFVEVLKGKSLTASLFGEVQQGITSAVNNYTQNVIPMFADATRRILRFKSMVVEADIVIEGVSRGITKMLSGLLSGQLTFFTQTFSLFLQSFKAFAVSLTGILTISGYFLFSGMFFREATQFIQRFLGIQHQLTLLERINRIVITIDKALHSVHLSVGSIFKSIGIGLAAFLPTFGLFLNPFSTIITKLAFANSIVSVIGSWLDRYKLRFLAFFGDGAAKIRLAFGNIKEFIFILSRSFDYLGGGVMLKATKIAAFFGGKGAKLQLAILKYREFFMSLANQLPKIMTALSGVLSKFPDVAIKAGNLQKGITAVQKPLALPSAVAASKSLALPAPTTTQRNIQAQSSIKVVEATQKVAVSKAINAARDTLNIVGNSATETVKIVSKSIGNLFQVVQKTIGRMKGNYERIVDVKSRRPLPENPAQWINSYLDGYLWKSKEFFLAGQKMILLAQQEVTRQYKETIRKGKIISQEQLSFKMSPVPGTMRMVPANSLFEALKVGISNGRRIVISDPYSAEANQRKNLALPDYSQQIKKPIITAQEVKKTSPNVIPLALPDLRSETERIRQEMLALLLRLKAMGMPLQDLANIFNRMKTISVAGAYRQQTKPVSGQGQVSNWTGLREGIPAKYVSGANLQALRKTLEEQLFAIKPAIYLKYGNEILREIARGIQANPIILQKATQKALQPIDDQLPHSPAKEGPLRTLRESGKSIFSELAIGMNNGAAVAKSAIVKVTTAIARFFPHSPAEEGPLRGLRQWGQGILSQLSLGITDKIQSVLNLFFDLANQIKATLKPVLEMSFMGERMGIDTQTVSLLEYAFAGFEVQANEVQMTMNSLNRTLAEVATPEKLSALAQVGINLQQVRSAANPTLEFFKQLSDAINKFPMSSDKMIKALEAVGMSTQSNLINAMAQGWPKIQASMAEGVQMGAAYEESFVKAGHSFTELMNKFDKIGVILEREFATTLMPIVDNLARKMFNFYKENSTSIRAIVRIAGESIGILVEMISNAVSLAWQNPTAFKDAIIGIAVWAFQSVGTLWDTFVQDAMDGLISHVWLFVRHTVGGALSAGWNLFSQLGITALNKFILYAISKVKETVELFAKLNFLSAIGLDFSKDISSLLDPLDKLAEDAGNSTKFSLEETLWKAADENAKIMADARKASAEEWQNIQDPEVMRKTLERFEQSFQEISSRFSGALQGTGFDKVFADGMERLKTALSPENFTGTKDEIATINQQMESLNEGLVSIGRNAGNAGQKVGEATGKVVDGIRNGIKTAEQELKSLGDKILGMQLDLGIRIAKNEDERQEAQRKKDLLDLQTKHSQELIEYQKLLQAQLLQDESYAKLSFDKQIEFIKGLDEYKQFIANQETERKMKETNATEDKSGGFFDKNQEDAFQAWQNSFNKLGTAFSNMYELMGEKAVAFFYLQKGVMLADATATGAMATLNAYTAGTKPPNGSPFLGVLYATMAGLEAATQIAVIAAQTIQGPTAMATGGFVPGTGNQDNVPIKATPGEFVIPKVSTKSLIDQYGLQMLEGLRRGYLSIDSQLPKPPSNQSLNFATGGTVPTLNVQQTSQQPQQQQPINIINYVDPHDIERYISSSRGQVAIVNVIQKNANKISKFMR